MAENTITFLKTALGFRVGQKVPAHLFTSMGVDLDELAESGLIELPEVEEAEEEAPENPIADYDSKNARDARKAIRQLTTREQLEAVRFFESQRSQPRKTVLEEIQSEIDELEDE